jgi:hypothetical protein
VLAVCVATSFNPRSPIEMWRTRSSFVVPCSSTSRGFFFTPQGRRRWQPPFPFLQWTKPLLSTGRGSRRAEGGGGLLMVGVGLKAGAPCVSVSGRTLRHPLVSLPHPVPDTSAREEQAEPREHAPGITTPHQTAPSPYQVPGTAIRSPNNWGKPISSQNNKNTIEFTNCKLHLMQSQFGDRSPRPRQPQRPIKRSTPGTPRAKLRLARGARPRTTEPPSRSRAGRPLG